MGGRTCAATATVVAIAAGVAIAAPLAVAETSVSGERDSNAPLVLDPSTDPTDAFTKGLTLSSTTVKFIQKMPVTKVVDEITIGDIGQATSCTTPSRTRLYVYEHPGDPADDPDLGSDFYAGQQIVYSTGHVSLPSAPEKVTYSIPSTTFRKGRGYSFSIAANYSGTDCKDVRQTTWAHNDSEVNAGPALCTGAPTSKRMWHGAAADDASAGCVTRAEPTRTFKPDMPSGWLVSRAPGVHWDIMSGSYPAGDPIPGSACGVSSNDSPLALGASPAYWRPRPNSNGTISEYACLWGQFADHGDTADDGWYYAQPWLVERGGAPRDMYLKLDTIDYDALLEAHVPILRYDTDEDFHAISPGAATDFYDASDDPDDPNDANHLVDSFGSFASANPWVAFDEQIDTLSLAYLGSAYTGVGPRGGTSAASTDYISERGDGTWGPFFSSDGFADDAAYMEGLPGYANRVYGRVAHGNDGKIWLQYWFFFYFDSQGDFGQNVHEGDWEMVQVGLGGANVPDTAAYAQHGDGERCDWATDVDAVDGRPVVYVGQGSHASYFRPGHYDDPDPDDDADGEGIQVTSPALVQIRAQSPSWVAWPGSWGDTDSPPGPAFQGAKWSDPTAWTTGLHDCDVG
jgi:hypothetical protein